jgi:Fe2+ or Zn2+ uptake regulation protein
VATESRLDELHRLVDQRLESRDQRYTSGRRQLVEALAGVDGPVTLPELLGRHPDIAQSSAYRNLAVLEEAGAVRRLVHGADFASYELAEDLTGHHHHHLICVRCGSVRDITLGASVERSLDKELTRLADAEGFTPTHHTIDILGACSTCSRRPTSDR